MKRYIKCAEHNVIETEIFKMGNYTFMGTFVYDNDEVVKISSLSEHPVQTRNLPYYYYATTDTGLNKCWIKNSNTGDVEREFILDFDEILEPVCNLLIELDETIAIEND